MTWTFDKFEPGEWYGRVRPVLRNRVLTSRAEEHTEPDQSKYDGLPVPLY